MFLRLGSITRPTADANTVARSQAELIRQLLADEITTVVTGGDVQVRIGDGMVEIDVMDLADDPLPGDDERRAFALARRFALTTAEPERIIVTASDRNVIVDEIIPVATLAALTALKAVPWSDDLMVTIPTRSAPTFTTSFASSQTAGRHSHPRRRTPRTNP